MASNLYRLYLSVVTDVHEIRAGDDDDALATARKLAKFRPAELWCGSTLVARFASGEETWRQPAAPEAHMVCANDSGEPPPAAASLA